MRVLFISQYFPPEMGAPAARTYELARRWVQLGAEVTVVTAVPNHPTGVVPERYRRGRLFEEHLDGIRVLRTWIYPAANRGFWRRSLNYVSFMCSSLCFGVRRAGPVDIVIATSPQFLVGLSGWVASRWRGVPFVFEVRDLWPDSIAALGVLREGLLLRTLQRLEMLLYRQAVRIVGVAHSTKTELVRRGVEPEKIVIIPNGADSEVFRDLEKFNGIRENLDLGRKFVVSYIGTHGLAHGLDTVLDCADRLRQLPDIAFLFVGDGAERERLVERAGELALPNVHFLGVQPRERIPYYLATSDVSLVPLRRKELFQKVLPSKLFEIMGCSRPVILGVEGEAQIAVERAEAGLCVAPEDPQQLAEAILTLFQDPALADRLGRNGRSYVRRHYCRDRLAGAYFALLRQVVAENR
ncbi:MAG TPA: glycosyltransferase family 4 protein [Candidatus Krumholzibacteria bacterium]|nr:glycosyltransferase family 4 protein [Candidatus Krumholzibacteria bacterium]